MPSESLKRAVIEFLETEFSMLEITTDIDAECFVTIRPAWREFGPVEILEHGGQLIVNWGRFTHSHLDSYDGDQQERIGEIIDHLRHQLGNVIADKVAFWGQSHGGSGGFYFLEHASSLERRHPAYLWSGKQLKKSFWTRFRS